MANLTISVDDEVLRMARARALQHRTSVDAILRDYLTGYVGVRPTAAALAGFLELAAASQASSGQGGRSWSRDESDDRTSIEPATEADPDPGDVTAPLDAIPGALSRAEQGHAEADAELGAPPESL